jgi:dUTP pyrophosphatase
MQWITNMKFIDLVYYFINKNTTFKVKLLTPDAKVPTKADTGCAGYDLYCNETVTIEPGKRKLVSTGIAVEFDKHFYLRVAPRSGLSVQGIDIGAGVIDSSYRGELKVLVINNTPEEYTFTSESRIAQLILERCGCVEINIVEIVSETTRGSGGFGSTGV